MDNEKNSNSGDGLESAIKGGAVSRRWLLKNSANMAAGTLAISSLSSATAEARPAAAIEKPSKEHDPHATHEPAYNAAAFEGWESV
jgi:hypothetical protein